MNLRDRLGRFAGAGVLSGAGALVSLAIAVALFTRFDIDGRLSRDESIYAYGGQQLTAGVPFYVSIFDAKTPLAAYLSGLGVAVANTVGADDLHAIRIVFFVCSCLTVVAVYLLGLWLWQSALAGLVGAAAFASFRGFALDAITGPNAKTPGILFAVVSMALVVRRRWFWGAFSGSLAFLVWQPLAIYAAVAVAVAFFTAEAAERRRALGLAFAGAALPVAATTLYYGLAGALPKFVHAAFVFPVTGLRRGQVTLPDRLREIVDAVHTGYGPSRVLVWGGLVLLLGLIAAHLVRGRRDLRQSLRHPLACAVAPSLAVIAGFSVKDFQGYPDAYPALPYAALGLGGAAALVMSRLRLPALRWGATAGALAAVAALVGLSLSWYSVDRAGGSGLVRQRAHAAAIERMLGPGDRLYSLGDPTPLVLTRRRNPSRFIYLSSGVAAWMLSRTPGGLDGWKAQIRASDPAVIVMHGWRSGLARRLAKWVKSSYEARSLGRWRVFLRPRVQARSARSRTAADGQLLHDPSRGLPPVLGTAEKRACRAGPAPVCTRR